MNQPSKLFDPLVPHQYRSWINDTGSLTARIRSCCQHQFHVKLLAQHPVRLPKQEYKLLDIPINSKVVQREVLLMCGTQTWVYACSYLPLQLITGHYARLAKLGERPLGEVIFSDPSLRRQFIELSTLRTQQPTYPKVLRQQYEHPPKLWGRRSIFSLGRKRLSVAEYFLPDIKRYSKA